MFVFRCSAQVPRAALSWDGGGGSTCRLLPSVLLASAQSTLGVTDQGRPAREAGLAWGVYMVQQLCTLLGLPSALGTLLRGHLPVSPAVPTLTRVSPRPMGLSCLPTSLCVSWAAGVDGKAGSSVSGCAGCRLTVPLNKAEPLRLCAWQRVS